jgi:hypothetical protein
MPTHLLRVMFLCVVYSLTLTSASAQDNWLGGTGNWSDSANWSGGVPNINTNVVIDSGGDDRAILDVNGISVNSLILGGTDIGNGTTSWLWDNFIPRTFSISGQFTLMQTGILALDGVGSTVSVGTILNNGRVGLGTGTTLNLMNQPGGVTDIVAGSFYGLFGSFNDVVNNASAIAHLTNIEPTASLDLGTSQNISPHGGVLTIGGFTTIRNFSTVNITGDVTSTYYLTVSQASVNVSGVFNNSGTFGMADASMTVGTLYNSGLVGVFQNGTLTVLNQPMGVGTDIPLGVGYNISGTFTTS